jgi:hypothetical protein
MIKHPNRSHLTKALSRELRFKVGETLIIEG